MGRSKEENKYIHNLARTIAGQLRIEDDTSLFESGRPGTRSFAGRIMYGYGVQISEKLRRYSPETLGKISACGLGTDSGAQFALCHVRDSSDRINWDHSGRELLVMLAMTTVVAAIADNLRAKHQGTGLASPENGAGKGLPGPNPGSGPGRRVMHPSLDEIESRRGPVAYEGHFGQYEEG